ncbi:MAG: Lrp/AsnC family transcriptional regulator [Peptococcaceae bacterium]|nr:Lrp/AsnC family transcriptional regulator [Peptococcaceae bacterium]
MLSRLEKEIVKALQEGLPLVSRPFSAMAEKLGITEEALLDKIRDMVDRGLIRRFGAAVRHQDLGYTANAMVVWKVPGSGVEEAGKIFSGFSEVSHCYLRKTSGEWEYNLFTMVHGRTEEECRAVARAMSEASGVGDYLVLFSTAELKKESMKYFV